MEVGTRVGQAYVAMAIDGDGMNEQIVDSIDAAGPGVEKVGEDHGERYEDSFEEGFFDRMRRKFQSRFHQELDEPMEKSGSDSGDRAGAVAAGHFIDALNFALSKESGEENPLSRMFDKMMNDAVSGNQGSVLADKVEKALTPSLNAAGDHAGDSAGHTTGNALVDGLREELVKAKARAAQALDQLLATDPHRETMFTLLARQARIAEDAAIRLERELRHAAGTASVPKPKPGPSKPTRSLGDIVGMLTGRGSRNNALNLLGSSMKGITDLIVGLGKKAKGVFTTFAKGWSEAEEGANVFQKGLSGISAVGSQAGSALGSLLKSGPAAAVAIGVVAAAASVMASVLSALVGIVAALASTILSALTAAAAVGAAGLLAVGVAAGLAVIAFTSMSAAQKKILTTSFAGVRAELGGLGQLVLTNLVPAFAVWANNIKKAIDALAPLAKVMGGALGKAGSIFTSALSGPGFQMFYSMLTKTLPGITTSLSAAFGNLANGLLAVFTPVLPYVQQFSRYLADVTARFQAWATSAKGQNQIADFVARSVTSLKALWAFLKQVGGVITDVLFSAQGQKAGNDIFSDMTKAVANFRKKITAANLEKWFKDATTLAKALGAVIKSLASVFNSLNDSGVLKATAKGLTLVSDGIRALSKLPSGINILTIAVKAVGKAFDSGSSSADAFAKTVAAASGHSVDSLKTLQGTALDTAASLEYMNRVATSTDPWKNFYNVPSIPNAPTGGGGGSSSGITPYTPPSSKTPKGPKTYHNPYIGLANSIIKNGPSIAAQIKNAIIAVNKQIANAMVSASKSATASAAQSSLSTLINNVTAAGKSAVNSARDALNSAAETLASASSAKAAQSALRKVRTAQKGLKAAIAAQKSINAAAAKLKTQKTVHDSLTAALNQSIKDIQNGQSASSVGATLLKTFSAQNATLADYAKARGILATSLQNANQKLSDAISLRDNYLSQVEQSIQSFAALTTAQAQVINGVTQALTSNDIVSNLQDKLTQITKFRDNLTLLLASGLSNDAYKQIIDAGVEAGSAYAQALVDGGSGAIANVNDLVASTNTIADQLGTEASSRLYQAGVDAAQGLVDGLTSLSSQLDSAATKLGNSIANAVKKALGIKSPSRVLRDMMNYVGDGAVLGLDDQHSKVSTAATRLASKISVSPEVAAYASRQGASPVVSGNPQRPIDLTIITPTEDPHAVAMETLNELTERL